MLRMFQLHFNTSIRKKLFLSYEQIQPVDLYVNESKHERLGGDCRIKGPVWSSSWLVYEPTSLFSEGSDVDLSLLWLCLGMCCPWVKMKISEARPESGIVFSGIRNAPSLVL